MLSMRTEAVPQHRTVDRLLNRAFWLVEQAAYAVSIVIFAGVALWLAVQLRLVHVAEGERLLASSQLWFASAVAWMAAKMFGHRGA